MQIPLFPLNTVLFPEGVLPLRVFEARYMDMVRRCMKDGTSFGVVRIAKGAEVGGPAETDEIGTLATIAAWDMPQLGLLHLRAIGGERFRIVSSATQPDGLKVAAVERMATDEDLPLAEAFRSCAELLRRVIDEVAVQRPDDGNADPINSAPFEPPFRFDSSVWVGNRLCEFLPVSLRAKQKLLQLQDATSRLEIVQRYLEQHGVLKTDS